MDFFEHPMRLLHMLWLAPLFGILVYWITFKRKSVLKTLFGDAAGDPEISTLSFGRRYLRLWLLFAALLLLCVAYARPRWGWRILPFSGRGRDLMVLIDVSKSMLSEDVRPSRLKHAKQFVRELVESTPGNRYGLVDFAGTAFLECPMTVDKTSLFQALDELDVDSIPVGGTNIENALKKAMLAFKAAEGGYKAIILITDGDELYGDSSKVVDELKKRKIPLFVVGIGDPAGDGLIKMTGADGKTKLLRDSMGKLVKSRLNEKSLMLLAKKTGGIYVRSTETNPGLSPVLRKIKELVPKEYSKGNCKRPIERFHYPLTAAVLLLLIRLAIGERKRRGGACAALILAVLFVGATFTAPTVSARSIHPVTAAPPRLAPPISAADKTTASKTEDAAKKQKPDTPVSLYNRALELQKKRNLKDAAKFYRQAVNMSKVSEEVRSKAFQNLGVISHQKGEALMRKDPDAALKVFDKAEQMYKESMRSDVRRKRVVLNQQRLLDDRRLAKLIKKRKEEMRKKREQARKNTQKALNQQKKENKQSDKNKKQSNKRENKRNKQQKNDKQNKRDKSQCKQCQRQNKNSKENQKSQSGANKQNKENQRQNQSEKKKNGGKGEKKGRQKQKENQPQTSKGDKNKQDRKSAQPDKTSSNDQERKETERKIDQAARSAEDYKRSAEKAGSKQDEKRAAEAKREIEKAKEEHKKGKGEDAEKHLRKALKKLAPQGQDKNDKNRDKKNSANKQSNGDKKKSKADKNGQKKSERNKALPKPRKGKAASAGRKGGKEKKIDPAQAAALLELMANDEKRLRDAIKERQKRNAGVSKVPKDW